MHTCCWETWSEGCIVDLCSVDVIFLHHKLLFVLHVYLTKTMVGTIQLVVQRSLKYHRVQCTTAVFLKQPIQFVVSGSCPNFHISCYMFCHVLGCPSHTCQFENIVSNVHTSCQHTLCQELVRQLKMTARNPLDLWTTTLLQVVQYTPVKSLFIEGTSTCCISDTHIGY
jgi:hypothetical protein